MQYLVDDGSLSQRARVYCMFIAACYSSYCQSMGPHFNLSAAVTQTALARNGAELAA